MCRGTFEGASRVPIPFRTSRRNVGLLLRRCRGQGPHLGMTGEPRGVSRVVAGFSSFDGEYSLNNDDNEVMMVMMKTEKGGRRQVNNLH